MSLPRPISFLTERAARLLRARGSMTSVELAFELLATRAPDEARARRMLETAFGEDPRLGYVDGRWLETTRPEGADQGDPGPAGDPTTVAEDPDRALLFLEGERPAPGLPFQLRTLAALRLRGDAVVAACGGDVNAADDDRRLRAAVRDTIDRAVLVVHDRPGAFRAFERWIGEPLDTPLSLRRLAVQRLELPASHDLEALAARLGLSWIESEDPLQYADVVDECLRALRRPGERLDELRAAADGAPPVDWSRFDFDREFVASLPAAPGTYRFFDRDGELLYVGKSKNLQRRLDSYFREGGRRSARVQRLLDRLHRIEYEASGSDLEAVLREAAAIRSESPAANVQRRSHPRAGRAARLQSILILESAEPPSVLRAYLIRSGRLIGRIAIGPRGGGLTRISRLLDDHFFSVPDGPTDPAGPDLDVELIVRWLTTNRDRAVAFDPTTLRSSREVVERLRWFLDNGSPFDPDGTPIVTR